MVSIRQATADDYDEIARVLDSWWGREVLNGLPRLFLQHFRSTSLVAERGPDLVAFLIGFVSPSSPAEAYIHYVGVRPDHRNRGLAGRLYGQFLAQPATADCSLVRAITSPGNDGSVEFHRRMGFNVSDPIPDYDGPGRDMVVFTRAVNRA